MKTRRLIPLNDSPVKMEEPLAVFCGVGNPKSFVVHLQREGYSVLLEKLYADHHAYTQRDLDEIARAAANAGAKSLLTTAKDAVKLQSLQLPLPTYSLDIEINLNEEADLESLLFNAVHQEAERQESLD